MPWTKAVDRLASPGLLSYPCQTVQVYLPEDNTTHGVFYINQQLKKHLTNTIQCKQFLVECYSCQVALVSVKLTQSNKHRRSLHSGHNSLSSWRKLGENLLEPSSRDGK